VKVEVRSKVRVMGKFKVRVKIKVRVRVRVRVMVRVRVRVRVRVTGKVSVGTRTGGSFVRPASTLGQARKCLPCWATRIVFAVCRGCNNAGCRTCSVVWQELMVNG
jgi:hypothetical protein